MSQATQQQRQEVKDHLNQIRNNLDKTLADARNVGQQMMAQNKSDSTKLGFETIEKSLEHSRAILNQTEKAWDEQTVGGGVR